MGRLLAAIVLTCLLAFAGACRGNQSGPDSRAGSPAGDHAGDPVVASSRREIVAPNVLAAQLAAHRELESKTTFTRDEPIQASIFLAVPDYVEQRRIVAFLMSGEGVLEEQTISLA